MRCLSAAQLASPRRGAGTCPPTAQSLQRPSCKHRVVWGADASRGPFLISAPPADVVSVNKENGEGVWVLSPSQMSPEGTAPGQSQWGWSERAQLHTRSLGCTRMHRPPRTS